MEAKYMYSVNYTDELERESTIYYHIVETKEYECEDCGIISNEIGSNIMCEDCGGMNQTELTKDIILFRKLINAKWVHYRRDKPNELTKFMRLINNVAKLDDDFWKS